MGIPVSQAEKASKFSQIEWPTIAVAVGVYTGFGLLTWWYAVLPWWVVLPLGAYFVAWQGSLQHEVVHGHPTPWPWVNEILVFPSLWLWLPFRLYRETHLAHHNDATLTDPIQDPESNYVTQEDWGRRGPWSRAWLWVMSTLAGRLLFVPMVCAWRLAVFEIKRFAAGDWKNLKSWGFHAMSCTLVFAWTVGVCSIPVLEYIVFFAYSGSALTLVRSYLEHQARSKVGSRTAIVESGPIMSLLYLNNNLHTLHHMEPGTPWYRLPSRYRMYRKAILEHNGGYLLSGYRWVFLQYLFWPKESPVHPLR